MNSLNIAGNVTRRSRQRLALPTPKLPPQVANNQQGGQLPTEPADLAAPSDVQEVRPLQARADEPDDTGGVRIDGVKGAISFSLFGTSQMYLHGAVRNAELAPKVYPGWTCVFYCAKEVPEAVRMRLRNLGAEVREPVEGIANEMFWRFCIADDTAFTHFIVRDTDSRLNVREKKAVEAWLDSGLDFHSAADHPHHSLPLGGGLWGGKSKALAETAKKIIASGLAAKPYSRDTGYGLDQTFLTKFIWPTAKLSCLRHDSCNRHVYTDAKPFPTGCRFGDHNFVGAVWDASNKQHPLHWQQRVNYQHV